jgi:hypothetical protein
MPGYRLILAFCLCASVLVVGEARAECGAIPNVAWWGDLTHAKIKQHVDQKWDGDWAAYIEQWATQQIKLQSWLESDSSAVIRNRIVSFNVEAVTDYMLQVEKRLEITHCLAVEEGFDGLEDFNVASGADDDDAPTK